MCLINLAGKDLEYLLSQEIECKQKEKDLKLNSKFSWIIDATVFHLAAGKVNRFTYYLFVTTCNFILLSTLNCKKKHLFCIFCHYFNTFGRNLGGKMISYFEY